MSLVQAKRWLLMPRAVNTHSSLGCSTAFSAEGHRVGSAPAGPPSPARSAPGPPRAPPDEAMVTRMSASPRGLCSSEYCSFSVTEARMSCTEAERRLRMVTYEWSGMYTRQKTGERAGGQRRAPPHHPGHCPPGKLRHGAGPGQSRRGHGWWVTEETPVPLSSPHSHSLSSEPRNATRVCRQESMRRKCRNSGFTCLFGGGVSSATLWGHRTGSGRALDPRGAPAAPPRGHSWRGGHREGTGAP